MIDAHAPSHIIFVTAYDQHAIEAFEVNAIDYLLKPVDPGRLETALQRVRRRLTLERPTTDGGDDRAGRDTGAVETAGGSRIGSVELDKIIRLVTEQQGRREQLALKVGERFLLVQAEDVIFASMIDDSISVVTRQPAGTSSYRTLDDLQARLDPNVFWRVHRAHLVNINMIKEIVPWFSRNYILKMRDEKTTEIPVSRTQTRRLREYLKL
jgi:two-component system LytT family response regulator/two-component system response regulator LytT